MLAGLGRPQKTLPCKYLYDATGSHLFDQICDLPEYYPTRTEVALLHAHAAEMGLLLGRGCQVVEYGSGSSTKTPLLLAALPRPAAYVPVDISAGHLYAAAETVAAGFPDLPVTPVAADFTRPFAVPPLAPPLARRAVFFPGSTIGNFAPPAATQLLAQMHALAGPGGQLLIGVDLWKDAAVLGPAYDDAAGVTAAFNRNLLARVNRELDADFDLTAFRHEARVCDHPGRVEMHLVSARRQEVTVAGERFRFAAGESIHTEDSHKYTVAGFRTLAATAGWRPVRTWVDGNGWFSVHLLACGPSGVRG